MVDFVTVVNKLLVHNSISISKKSIFYLNRLIHQKRNILNQQFKLSKQFYNLLFFVFGILWRESAANINRIAIAIFALPIFRLFHHCHFIISALLVLIVLSTSGTFLIHPYIPTRLELQLKINTLFCKKVGKKLDPLLFSD